MYYSEESDVIMQRLLVVVAGFLLIVAMTSARPPVGGEARRGDVGPFLLRNTSAEFTHKSRASLKYSVTDGLENYWFKVIFAQHFGNFNHMK